MNQKFILMFVLGNCVDFFSKWYVIKSTLVLAGVVQWNTICRKQSFVFSINGMLYFVSIPDFLSRTMSSVLNCCVVLWHPASIEALPINCGGLRLLELWTCSQQAQPQLQPVETDAAVYMCKFSTIRISKSIRVEIPTSLLTWALNKVIQSWHVYTCTMPLIRINHFDIHRVF